MYKMSVTNRESPSKIGGLAPWAYFRMTMVHTEQALDLHEILC